MKRTIKWKNLICLIAVLILLVSISASSYAIWNPFDYQRNRAFVAAALTALNIAFQSQQMAAQSVVEYIADPLEVNYTYIDAWQDRPQIQIWDDYVEIDGVKYTDIWISNEAAEKFRVNAFDFNTAYQIASNDSGTFASGVGTFDGIPIYSINGENRSQNYIINGAGTFPAGNGNFAIQYPSGYQFYPRYNASNGQGIGSNYYSPAGAPYSMYIRKNSNTSYSLYSKSSPVQSYWVDTNSSISSNIIDNTPFDFDWVATDIPLDQPLPSDTGMMIRVPSNDPLGNPYFDDFLVDNPEFKDGPVTIDVDLDPDVMNKLGDLINIIAPIIPNINNNMGDVNFIENHETPAPVPDTPIVDATVPQVVNPIINEISNYGDQITQQIPNIIESIPNINEICNNIDTAPYHDLDTGLNRLPSFFLPFITDLRSALGIWHYVTEWLAQISTTFAFISGCLVGTSIMTPIYAAIAGFMCIKIYRRMTA